jgi:hypothetical protein
MSQHSPAFFNIQFMHFSCLRIGSLKYLFVILELQAKKLSAWFVIASLPKMKLFAEKWDVAKIV